MRITKITVGGLAMLACGACAPALANHQYDGVYYPEPVYDDGHDAGEVYDADYSWARVVHVEPLVRHVRVQTPRRQCYDDVEYQTYRAQDRSYHRHGTAGATIVGGLLGGLVGRQFGSGDGRDGATLVGTLVGSAIANDRAHRHNADHYGYAETRAYPVEVQRCHTSYVSHSEERMDGYRVTYEYDGKEYSTHMHRHPGERIRVRVAVTPAEEY